MIDIIITTIVIVVVSIIRTQRAYCLLGVMAVG